MIRIHTQSIRLASGEEALVTRAVAEDGRTGFGYSLRLDATEARHMAQRNAALPAHALPAEIEAALSRLKWFP